MWDTIVIMTETDVDSTNTITITHSRKGLYKPFHDILWSNVNFAQASHCHKPSIWCDNTCETSLYFAFPEWSAFGFESEGDALDHLHEEAAFHPSFDKYTLFINNNDPTTHEKYIEGCRIDISW